jgi:hypothetical protein
MLFLPRRSTFKEVVLENTPGDKTNSFFCTSRYSSLQSLEKFGGKKVIEFAERFKCTSEVQSPKLFGRCPNLLHEMSMYTNERRWQKSLGISGMILCDTSTYSSPKQPASDAGK